MAKVAEVSPQRLSIGVLTVSDTRTEENDTSGDYLIQALEAQKHRAVARSIVPMMYTRYELRYLRGLQTRISM